jgi:hypothetical protein
MFMAREEKIPCIEFTLWVNGEKAKACTHVGTMLTIGWQKQVFGLSPTLTADDPKRLSVALLKLKSDEQELSTGKVLRSLDVSFGKRASFEPNAPITFKAANSGPTEMPKKRCCVTCSGIKICTSCTVEHSCGNCCASDECCKKIGTPLGTVVTKKKKYRKAMRERAK